MSSESNRNMCPASVRFGPPVGNLDWMLFYVKQAEVVGETMTVAAGGELDLCAAAPIRDALAEAFGAGPRRVVLDLSDATFIDSTVIGMLMGASRRLRDSGSRLQLRCTNRNILRVFEIAGLERHIPVCRDPDPSEQVVVVSTGIRV